MTEPNALQAPTVLANRGVPVQVYETTARTNTDGSVSYEPDYDMVTTKFVKLDALAVSRIEEHYGSLDKWQAASETQPTRIVVDTLAFVWRETTQQVSARLFEGQITQYLLALQIGAYRSQGVAVDDLGKLLQRGMEDSREQLQEVSTALLGLLENESESKQNNSGDEQPSSPPKKVAK